MAKIIMIQGTMSSVGKSILCTGLCRVFYQDGYRVAPFKSQNMALNSFVTKEGLEMGRAQVVQAESCGIEPDVRMNPILLKPTTDVGSQVILQGKVHANMRAMDYYRQKKSFLPLVMESFKSLEEDYEIIVIEGAGSPVELNLLEHDIVNMGFAALVDAPVLLVGDIDRGGIFAQLYGTVKLLSEEDRNRIKGLVVNKFRGDRELFASGLKNLEDLCEKPVCGVVPYVELDIDDEDSLSGRYREKSGASLVKVGVIAFPKISNVTDVYPLGRFEGVSVHYVSKPEEILACDLLVLPGSKSTAQDLHWLREQGLDEALFQAKTKGTLIFGICGGYQMLGQWIEDPLGVEMTSGEVVKGLGFLEHLTTFKKEKIQRQVQGVLTGIQGILAPLNGLDYRGYEIHMGHSLDESQAIMGQDNVYGTYIHGIFDQGAIAKAILELVFKKKGLKGELKEPLGLKEYKEREYDKLAMIIRENLDMDMIYHLLGLGKEE